MEQTQSSQHQTTTVCIKTGKAYKTQENEQIKMTRVKQTNGFQICMYLISKNTVIVAIYFLAVALFYLVASLLRTRYIECQLQCQESDLLCKCQLEIRVGWSTSTFVQLSWSESQKNSNQFEEIAISQAILLSDQKVILFQSESYTEVNCFPNECLALVGTVNQSIADNSTIIIRCTYLCIEVNNNMSIAQNQNPKLFFREVNQSYPQLQTYSQLGINLFFSIMVGIFVFFRQKLQMQMVPPLNFNNPKICYSFSNQKSNIEYPEDIIALNNQLQKNRSKAARYILNTIGKNILTYPNQDEFSQQFTYTQ